MTAHLVGGLLGVLLLAACGGEKGTVSVRVLTPPGDDIFQGASEVRMSVGSNVKTAGVSGGRFDVKIEIKEPPQDQYVRLTIEALSSSGAVIGIGRTPEFVLVPKDFEIAVYVGRPGQVTPTEVSLIGDDGQAAGRRDHAGVVLRGRQTAPVERGLGALITGGVDAQGRSLRSAWVYDAVSHRLTTAGKTMAPRRGAVLVPVADAEKGQQALLWGGASTQGDEEAELATQVELFDPQAPKIEEVFLLPAESVRDPGPPGAVFPTVAEVQPGVFLVSGGRERKKGGEPERAVNQALLLRRFPSPGGAGARRLPGPMMSGGPMVAARYRHSATPLKLAEGSALLLFGGLDEHTAQPAAELYIAAKEEFRRLDLMVTQGEVQVPLRSRRGHVAAALGDTRILVAGGAESEGGAEKVLSSALIIDAAAMTVTLREGLLATARRDATISRVGDKLLICGGFDGSGQPIGSCEILGAGDAQRACEPVSMTGRAGHLALQLETDQLLLVGGVGAGGAPLATIDLFTPPVSGCR